MARNHPVDPDPGDPHPGDLRPEGGPHPAVSLIAGFGLIILLAAVVYVVFNRLV